MVLLVMPYIKNFVLILKPLVPIVIPNIKFENNKQFFHYNVEEDDVYEILEASKTLNNYFCVTW